MRQITLLFITTILVFSGAAQDNSFKTHIERLGNQNPDSSLIYLEQWKNSLDSENDLEDVLDYHLSAARFHQSIGNFPVEKDHWIKAIQVESDSDNIQDYKIQLGLNLLNQGLMDSSFQMYEETMRYFEFHKIEKGIASSNNGMANALQNMGDNKSAIEKFNRAAEIYEAEQDHLRLSQVHNNIALSYRDLGESKKAFDHRKIAYTHALKTKDPYEINFASMGMGAAYREIGNLDSAKHYLTRAATYFEENPDPRVLVGTYNELGIMASDQDNPLEAVAYYEKSLHIIRSGGYLYALPGTLANYGTICYKAGKYESGLEACREALPYAVDIGYLEGELTVCACLYNNFKGLAQYDSALHYFERSKEIEDSLTNNEIQKAVLQKELEMKHASEKELIQKENELKRQRDKDLADSEISSQKVWRNVLVAGCLILLVALIMLLISWKNKRKSHQIVANEKEYLDNLLHNLVHEFRTPLTLIQGPVQELGKEYTDNKLLKIVDRNSSRMLDLVNQVLDFAKIKAGKLEVKNEITNVPIFANDTLDIFKPMAGNKSIELSLENDMSAPIVGVDSDKLYKILSNLISNALKYTNEGGMVKVALSGNSSVIKLEVSDNGIGINKADMNRVFDKFYQVDATTTRKGEGTGLGLAFVKELVELMGGQIDLQSELNNGSQFTVLLPVTRIADQIASDVTPKKVENPSENQTNTEPSTDRDHVLIIEDNFDMRNYLKMLLEDMYEVSLSEDGAVGIELAQELTPDIIISDVMMPKKDGYQVVDELKQLTATEHIPIIMLTAKASFDSKLKGFSHGADAYLSKPFSSDELKLRVANQLRMQKKLWSRYQQTPQKETPNVTEHPFVGAFREMLISHINKPLSADELAENMALSRSQLHRKLKALTGLSTTGLVNQIKMELALEMLADKSKNVSEIAYALGYSDPAYFSKLFKKHFGKTPTDIDL